MVKSVTPEFSSVSGKGKRKKKKDTTQYNVCSVYKYHFFHRHNLYNLSQLVTRDRQRGGNRKIQQKFSLLEQIKDRRWQTKITRLQYCHGLICTKTGLLCSVCETMYECMLKESCVFWGMNGWMEPCGFSTVSRRIY